MSLDKTKIKDCHMISALLSLVFVAALIPQPSFAQNKVIATYTLPDTPIKAFQNAALPRNVANDRKVLLGSVGSDLWHGPKDPRDEFWMFTDRGPQRPNQSRREEPSNLLGAGIQLRRSLESKQRAKRSRFWTRSRSSANRGSR